MTTPFATIVEERQGGKVFVEPHILPSEDLVEGILHRDGSGQLRFKSQKLTRGGSAWFVRRFDQELYRI